MKEKAQPYIFVSYAHKDASMVLPLLQGLQKRNFRIWYDAGTEAGSEWPEYIAERLLDSECILAFISKNSMESLNCRREINFAVEERKKILTVYLEEVRLSPGMRMQLGILQAVFRNPSADNEDFVNTLAQAQILQPCRVMGNSAYSDSVPRRVEEIILDTLLDASNGDAAAQFELGYRYFNGIDVDRDSAEAVKWFRMAAEQGHVGAQMELALCLICGLGVAENPEEGRTWYRRAAEQGNAEAQYWLGTCYEEGPGALDPAEAVKWYREAAEQGYADAMDRLGRCLETGFGVAKCASEAVSWYQKAADSRSAKGAFHLARCYEEGLGVGKDSSRAMDWYYKAAILGSGEGMDKLQDAANQGNVTAQFRLAELMYYRFDNDKEAEHWYREAAAQGHPEAQARLKEFS